MLRIVLGLFFWNLLSKDKACPSVQWLSLFKSSEPRPSLSELSLATGHSHFLPRISAAKEEKILSGDGHVLVYVISFSYAAVWATISYCRQSPPSSSLQQDSEMFKMFL